MQTDTIKKNSLTKEILTKAFELMCTARAMSDLFEEKSAITQKYVHATSRGHEAVQLALGLQLKPQDYLSAYYRDDSILLGIGLTPYELMLQLLAKRDDPFFARARSAASTRRSSVFLGMRATGHPRCELDGFEIGRAHV